ncbi:MAG: hypothetical protein V3T40_05425 [Nitrososphaerales archaeon]
MRKNIGKIFAGSIIVIMTLSIFSIVTPAFSEQSQDNQTKHGDEEERKDKARDHDKDRKDKAKDHDKDRKDGQQAASIADDHTTNGVDDTTSRSSDVKKLHRGSTMSFMGSGEASKRHEDYTAQVSAEFELTVFRATPHMILLKIKDGSITVGDLTYTVERGKTLIAMKAHKIILRAKVSSDDGMETLKLIGSTMNPTSDGSDEATTNTHVIKMEGKLAKWFITMNVEVAESG